MDASGKFVLLAFVSVFLLSAKIGNSFVPEASFEKTASSDSFPQASKFYTLVGRTLNWASVGGKNVTTGHNEELHKWSVKDVVGDVVLVSRTIVDAYIEPETGENYTETYDFEYQIAANRTILSLHFNDIVFTTAGFVWSGEGWLDADVGEHTWAWFSTDLHIGVYVLVGWLNDKNFLDDMLYEVVGNQVIQVIGEKQDCWMLRMPPSVTVDGLRARTETYWVDKDTGIPLKVYSEQWALDGSSGYKEESVLVNTNIDLGPESADEPSPTYTLTILTTPGFPQASKFCTSYYVENGWYMSGETNITYYTEGLFTIWVVNVTGNEAFVHRILWFEQVSAAEGLEELEAAGVQYYNYTINTNTREILNAAGSFYSINMTSLTYSEEDRTPTLAGDIGEETLCWLPKNLYLGAVISISWTRDMPWNVDNGTYTVTGKKMVNAFDKPQECWILHMPPTPSIDNTWNYTETYYSDKDAGISLASLTEGWTIDGNSSSVYVLRLIDTNVDLGTSTYVFQAVADSQSFNITVVTNSTIPTQTFDFSQGEKKISFDVTGLSGTAGFCNITIPSDLLWGEFSLYMDGSLLTRNVDYVETFNGTHYTFQIAYQHSTHNIEITSTEVIPEFPSFLILPLFMIATLLALTAYRGKRR